MHQMKPTRIYPRARFLVTASCPYSCSYCHREGLGNEANPTERFNIDDYLFVAAFLKENYDTTDMTLSGGEPFAVKEIGNISLGIKSLGLTTTIITKGAGLYERLIRNEFTGSEFDWIYFSVDSLDKYTFSFITGAPEDALPKMISAMSILNKKGVNLKMNVLVPPDAIDNPFYLLDFIEFARNNDIESIKFVEVLDINRKKQPYIEKCFQKLNIDVNEEADNRRINVEIGTQHAELTRCMCSVTMYINEVTCATQDLYIGYDGLINPCILRNARENPYAVSILRETQRRQSDKLISIFNNLPLGTTPCPVLE